MGVEGKERSRELETGAQVLSGNMGKTIQRLRKAYSRQVHHQPDRAQRDQPDAGHHLAAEPGP
ncbi:MAG: family transcriptional regulator [Microvirga sp.]|nr:family transcriptional regulator [Microvirga sp.]